MHNFLDARGTPGLGSALHRTQCGQNLLTCRLPVASAATVGTDLRGKNHHGALDLSAAEESIGGCGLLPFRDYRQGLPALDKGFLGCLEFFHALLVLVHKRMDQAQVVSSIQRARESVGEPETNKKRRECDLLPMLRETLETLFKRLQLRNRLVALL